MIAGGFAVSLLLHAAVILVLLVRLKWEPEPEPLPPPSPVDVVFESGKPEGPSTPEPSPEHDNAPPTEVGGPSGGQLVLAPPPPVVQPAPIVPPAPIHATCTQSFEASVPQHYFDLPGKHRKLDNKN